MLYLITGVLGHVGNTLARMLCSQGHRVRGLALPGDKTPSLQGLPIDIFRGDMLQKQTMEEFTNVGQPACLIHTAGLVSISTGKQQLLHKINVEGTARVLEAAVKKNLRMVYVSSVHALPEGEKGSVIMEQTSFSPDAVKGAYAKSKAEATQLVLASGANATVVHPSGIIGPYDYGRSHTGQMIRDFCEGRLLAGVSGGYDFVDVRDVAKGIITAAERGTRGEGYILSGHYVTVKELLTELAYITGCPRVKGSFPLWLAKATAPFAEGYYRLLRQPPLFTGYSLYTLSSNALFSYKKAHRELWYTPRPLADTLRDTVRFYLANGMSPRRKKVPLPGTNQ